MYKAVVDASKEFSISKDEGQWQLNEKPVDLDIRWQPNGIISILYNGKSFSGFLENVDTAAKEITVSINGQSRKIAIKEPIDQLLSSMGMDMKVAKKMESIKAPMPGMVLKLLVEPGQAIEKGDGLLILEAMKMENVLKAPGAAIVKSIKVNERTAVEKGAVLIELE
jgi:biotin carboxyl carrier protein